ncbi:putative cytosolic protein [Acidisarcina polymorpha]|uniref:Putative cytosolic protein n=1 Tax=Acidisarcina polymorpha TaxID=2211140 RepID=A0A2Z5FXG5_9BACT|nr:putative cytosolic protein [Acidisarcina polymorpha]
MVALLLRAIGATLRFEYVVEPGLVPPTKATPGIYCFWHRCALPALLYFHGKLRCSILVSQSFDGELIARTIERFGFDAVRGSSSREGAAGLLGLKRAIDAGFIAVFTADGPRGPRFKTKVGPVKLAQMSQMPVGILYLLPERAWVANSWDGFLIPKPFSRVAVSWAHKVNPPVSNAGSEELEAVRMQVEVAMERARRLAEEYFAIGSGADRK